jgi:protein-S-isoprenylcysteine O-methyltransferase Ste14
MATAASSSTINITARNSLPIAIGIVAFILIFAAANLGTTPKDAEHGSPEYNALVMSGMTVAAVGAALLVLIVLTIIAFSPTVALSVKGRQLAVAGGRNGFVPYY